MRRLKSTIKSAMSKKGIKTGQIAPSIGMQSQPLSLWFVREDGQSIDKAIDIIQTMNCDLAIIDRETGEVFKVS